MAKKAALEPLAEVLPRPRKPLVVLFNTTHQTILAHAVDGVSTLWFGAKQYVELSESEISSDIRSHMAAGRLLMTGTKGV